MFTKEKIDLSNLQMLGAMAGLNYLINKEVKASASLRLWQNFDKIEKECKVYNKVREKLYEGHCQLDDKGEMIIVDNKIKFLTKEDEKIVVDELEKLNELKNTFNLWRMKLSSIGDPNELKLFGTIWRDLQWLVIEEEAETPTPYKPEE